MSSDFADKEKQNQGGPQNPLTLQLVETHPVISCPVALCLFAKIAARMHVLCLIVLSLAMAQQNEPHNPFAKANQTDKPSTQSQNKESSSNNDRLCTSCEINEQPSKTQKEKDDDTFDRRFQRVYWAATIVGVCGGLFLLCIVWKQANALIHAERAWLMSEMTWTPLFSGISEGNNGSGPVSSMVNLRLCYRNDGNTPAWIEKIEAKFEMTNQPPQKPNLKNMKIIQEGTIPVGIGGKDFIDCDLNYVGRLELGKKNIVYGLIYYRDAFKERRRTFFGYEIRGSQIVYLTGYPEYNKHT